MEPVNDGPRPVAFLICQAISTTPLNGLSLIEVAADAQTWEFPNALPPFFVVCILVGGRPKTVYSTEWSLLDMEGKEVGKIAGPDAPFTTQIRRVNMFTQLGTIAPGYQVTGPGRLVVRLSVSGTIVGETDLTIFAVPKPIGTQERS